MSRTLLSYDDITASAVPSQPAGNDRHPKRRKRDGLAGSNASTKSETIFSSHPHWDDTNECLNVTVNYGDDDKPSVVPSSTSLPVTNDDSLDSNQTLGTANATKRSRKKKRGARSKILGEIPPIPAPLETKSISWDDNQLADAWNAANEEYEVSL